MARWSKHRGYFGYVLAATFGYSGIFCFISGSSFVFINVLDVPPKYFGFCFGVFVIGYIIGATSGGKLAKRFSPPEMVGIGSIIALLSALGLVVHQSGCHGFGLDRAGAAAPLYDRCRHDHAGGTGRRYRSLSSFGGCRLGLARFRADGGGRRRRRRSRDSSARPRRMPMNLMIAADGPGTDGLLLVGHPPG